MPNPNYFAISEQLKNETDPAVRQQLKDQLYVFEEELTEEEKSLFGYWAIGYIQDDPGYIENEYTSFVGRYFSSSGEDSVDIENY